MNKPMTEAQYVRRHGGCCPVCRSGYIMAGDTDAQGTDDLSQEVRCEECGEEWVEFYKLQGYALRCRTCRLMKPGCDCEKKK